MRIRIAWKIGLLVTGCVVIVGAIAGVFAYQTAIGVLIEHEIVDLKDDTRVRANDIASQIATLREDALRLARIATVLQVADAADGGPNDPINPPSAAEIDGRRAKLQSSFQRACWDDPKTPKPYSQVRFIGKSGRELVRVGRKVNGTKSGEVEFAGVPFDELDRRPEYDNADRSSFKKANARFAPEERPAEHQFYANRVFLSDVELNVEDGRERPDEPTIRAWVPVLDAAKNFGGIVIINMDFQHVRKGLAASPRHLAYLTNERGDFLVHPNTKLEFVWDDPEKNPGKHDKSKQEAYSRIQDQDDLGELKKLYQPDYHDRLVLTSDGSERRELSEQGFRFPKPPERLKPKSESFALCVVQLVDESVRPELEKAIERLREEGFRVPPTHLNATRDEFPISTPNNADQVRMRNELSEEFGSAIRFKYFIRCESFAAHFFRIYIDPDDPTRYFGLAMAFSYEEMDAELGRTKMAIFWSVALLTAGVALLALVFSHFMTRRLTQITVAAKGFAAGVAVGRLPLESRDEIGDLARGFEHMINEVAATHQQLKVMNANLDHRVKNRTKELEEANEELKEARDKAHELSSAKDAFLASVSHELRNPLNQVSGYRQLLELSDLDDEQRADLKKIESASEQLLILINDILDYQKIIMGGITLEPEDLSTRELMEEVCDAQEMRARENGSQLVIECGEEVGLLYADKQRLRQVLLNLVGNACKFTENGTVTLSAARVGELDNQTIVFEVADTGRGMTQEEQDKLFTPFTKLSARQGNQTGTGLGLVISKGFCELMRGRISLKSEFDKGSKFIVELPASRTSRAVDASMNETVDGGVGASGGEPAERESPDRTGSTSTTAATDVATATANKPNRTVLVIDDDSNVREIMMRYLKGAGFHVVTAANGREGVEIAERLQPAVITLDVNMPNLDGWNVLAELKANPQTKHIPVIMITITDDEERGYSLGATEFLSKPVDWECMSETLARYTGNKRDRSILVVDDEAAAREIVRRNLERDGWSVLEAANGKTALDLLAVEQPAAIILDLTMPVMDGFEFLTQYCQTAEWLTIPVIVVTAQEPTPEELSQLDDVVVRVLRKGQYTQDEMLKEIHRRVDQHMRG